MDISSEKAQLRAKIRAARTSMEETEKLAADSAIAEYAAQIAQNLKVAAFYPQAPEPGFNALVSSLEKACTQVWLPISGPNSTLSWAQYQGEGSLGSGALGICEPTGARRDSSLLAELDIIFTPALALSQSGYRLGQGAGYYDRAFEVLANITPPHGHSGPVTIGVVYDSEILPTIPHEPHDAPVHKALTQSGLRTF